MMSKMIKKRKVLKARRMKNQIKNTKVVMMDLELRIQK